MEFRTGLVIFRNDLRTDDQPALRHAIESCDTVIPFFIWDEKEGHSIAPGSAAKWWLHESLASLSQELKEKKSRLVIRLGKAKEVINELLKETSAEAVFWNRRYDPDSIRLDKELKTSLKDSGIHVESFKANLLYEPWEVETQQGNPYQVFTPFWKSCGKLAEPEKPASSPGTISSPEKWPASEKLEELELKPKIHWTEGMEETWKPGSVQALKELKSYVKKKIQAYSENRDFPGTEGTSRLSPYLHFGEISPRRIWHEIRKASSDFNSSGIKSKDVYLSEIGWREFAHHILYYFPHTLKKPLRDTFEKFPWEKNRSAFNAWKRGRTGVPIVDAGMRELWTTGWMHNRVRMIVGSYLTKDLRISWTKGADWFLDTLVDADLANNTMGWQWVAGCGADAAPYFRIFNPYTQSKKFDPDGKYIRKWVPEIAELSNSQIHQPSEVSGSELKKAGITLGETYPHELVDHSEARNVALKIYDGIK